MMDHKVFIVFLQERRMLKCYTISMIIFARHGETVAGVEDRYVGRADSPLTEKGKRQAKLLGEYFLRKKPSQILVSPRGRAIATAEIASGILGVTYQVDDRLAEICYGSWELKTHAECRKSPLWEERERDFFYFRHPGFYQESAGESYEELYNRLVNVYSELEKTNGLTLIVAHSGVLRCARKYFENVDSRTFMHSKFENSVFLSVEKNNTKYSTSLIDVTRRVPE